MIGPLVPVLTSLLLSCAPELQVFSPTPALRWDKAGDAQGYRLQWRFPGDVAWRGKVDLPCVDWWECEDLSGEAVCTRLPEAFCRGVDAPVAPYKYFRFFPMFQEVEFSVRAYNASGLSPNDSEVLAICWPEQKQWGF